MKKQKENIVNDKNNIWLKKRVSNAQRFNRKHIDQMKTANAQGICIYTLNSKTTYLSTNHWKIVIIRSTSNMIIWCRWNKCAMIHSRIWATKTEYTKLPIIYHFDFEHSLAFCCSAKKFLWCFFFVIPSDRFVFVFWFLIFVLFVCAVLMMMFFRLLYRHRVLCLFLSCSMCCFFVGVK